LNAGSVARQRTRENGYYYNQFVSSAATGFAGGIVAAMTLYEFEAGKERGV